MGQLTDAAAEAVQALRDLLRQATPPTARVSAARALLEHTERWTSSIELEGRVKALEDAAREAGHHAKEYVPAG